MGSSRRAATWDEAAWRADAACRGHDPDLFFPSGTTGPATAQIALAKQVCASCPVTDACLAFAIMTNQEDGVWGGTDEDERRSLRRAWRRAQRAAAPAS